jgi:hypothetical protein
VRPKNPIVGRLSGCCTRAASGHPAAAPPSSVMNWRRPPQNPLCQLTAGSGCPGSARRSLG